MSAPTKRKAKRKPRPDRAPAPAHKFSSSRPKYSPVGLRKARLAALFMQEHLIHLDGDIAFKPLIPVEFQFDNVIQPIFASVDALGRRRIRKFLFGGPRDAAKTEIAAAIVLTLMFLEPKYKGQYYVVARDKQQARTLFDKARTMVLHDPILRRACTVYKDVITVNETGAIFKVLPGDEKSVQSLHPDVCVIDEYHVAKNTGVYDAMTSGMIGNWAHGALLIVTSTAAPARKGPLWDLIKKYRKDRSAHIYWAGADDGDDPHDPKTWRKANPMPWISISALREAHNTLPPWEFERYHLNRFPLGKSAGRAFDPKDWAQCQKVPEWDESIPAILTGDAGMRGDHMVISLTQRLKDGTINNETWVWDEVMDDGELRNILEVEAHIVELNRVRNIGRNAFDPAKWWRMMQVLEQEHNIEVEEFPQSGERMCPASQCLLDEIRDHHIRAGRNPALREHIHNAAVAERPPRGWRITRAADDEKIDGAIALAIGVYLAIANDGVNDECWALVG